MKTRNTITYELARIAAPLVMGSILQQLYNAADSIIIGRFLGENAFAATGVAGTLMNLFIFVLSGCCTGVSIILAQLYGKQEHGEYRQEFFIATVAGLSLAVVLSAVGSVFLTPILRLLQTPEELLGYARAYLLVILLGIPITFLYNLFAAVLRSIGNTRAALIFLIVAVIGNVGMDCLFIVMFQMGVAGAAWATILAQLLSAVLCFFYIRRTIPHLLFGRQDMKMDGRLLKKTAHFGLVSALQQSSLYIGKLLVVGRVNQLGTASVAAYTATMRIEGFLNTLGDGGATASSVLVAQNYGRGDRASIRRIHGVSLRMHITVGLFSSALMFAAAAPASRLFLPDGGAETIRLCVSYLRCVAVFYVLNFIGFAFNGYFRGIGRVSVPTMGSTLHISLRVILTYALAARMDITAVALATGLGWISVVIFDSVCYARSIRSGDLEPAA